MSRILLVAEHDGQSLKKATRQALSAARAFGGSVDLLLAGASLDALAAEAACLDLARVLVADAPHLAHPLAEDVSALIVSLAGEYTVILAPHTSFARNVLPRAAALLDTAMVTDVVAIAGPKTYVRPTYTGNVLATVENPQARQILTVRPTAFEADTAAGQAPVEAVAVPAATTRARFLREERNTSDRPDLSTARVVVSGGRSLAERFEEVLGPLAGKLGGALGATRAAVDAGFAPNDIQVGSTGTVVAPELYIAAGVSGAPQHLAGMKDSKIIVAINHDPDAPIFNVADFGLVADLFEAVPELTAKL